MNHTRIATEAIRFRMTTIRRPLLRSETIDVEAMATAAIVSMAPEVDGALRRLATAWIQAGFNPEDLSRSWQAEHAAYVKSRPDLIDAIDVILRGASAANAAA